MSIYKKQSDNFKTFETAEDFLKYYENNRKDIDECNTCSLNLKFKITGHRIGRKQGKIILYPTGLPPKGFPSTGLPPKNVSDEEPEEGVTVEKYEQLKQAVLQLNERLKIIEERLHQEDVQQQNLKQSSSFQLYYHK